MTLDREQGVASPLAAGEGQGIRVLAAEDNPVFQSMLRSMLKKWGYDPVIARDGAEAWQILESENAPRLAILDWMMPELDGVEICRRVRAAGREPYIYIVLLTARTESQDLVEGMESGADDYLTKPFVAQELRVRLRAGRRILALQSQLVAAREALRIQATHDGLTNLMNRGAILEAMQATLSRAARERGPVAVLLADIDRFKSINDTLGHQTGDDILRESAARMKSAMRAYDVVGRYGGEEFLVVLPGSDGAGARAQAERVRESFTVSPVTSRGHSLNVTCSFGVSWRAHATPADADALIREADLALYSAKANGRNRVEIFEPELVAA
ncbi:MAG TPA: diguanylate cyclase [Bryobacteraceae bacterium]|jgi:diguanylate cyclase (GGDEF)-like protein|nr:diguanylate cyclase [Bryobacteraceae bacterium]